MGGTLTCSPLVFCFCLSCNSWNVFPLGNSKMLLQIRKKNATSASIEDSIFRRNIIITASGRGLEGCLCHTKTSHLSELFLWRKKHLFSFSFLFSFYKPSPSHRSQASCCSACTRGLLRFRLCENKEMQNVPVKGGLRRRGGGTKRKEIVVLWFMKGWKMEQPCLPAVMTVIVSKWLPAGERSSEFCPGQRWTV